MAGASILDVAWHRAVWAHDMARPAVENLDSAMASASTGFPARVGSVRVARYTTKWITSGRAVIGPQMRTN